MTRPAMRATALALFAAVWVAALWVLVDLAPGEEPSPAGWMVMAAPWAVTTGLTVAFLMSMNTKKKEEKASTAERARDMLKADANDVPPKVLTDADRGALQDAVGGLFDEKEPEPKAAAGGRHSQPAPFTAATSGCRNTEGELGTTVRYLSDRADDIQAKVQEIGRKMDEMAAEKDRLVTEVFTLRQTVKTLMGEGAKG